MTMICAYNAWGVSKNKKSQKNVKGMFTVEGMPILLAKFEGILGYCCILTTPRG